MTSVTAAVTEHTSRWTITRLISCLFKRQITEMKCTMNSTGSLGANGLNSLPGLKRTRMDRFWSKALHAEGFHCLSFVPRVLCSRTLWARRAVGPCVKPKISESTTLCPEPRLLWIYWNHRCTYGFINDDVDTLWSMTEWSQPLMALNYNLFLPFELEPWGWSQFGNGGGIVLRLVL